MADYAIGDVARRMGISTATIRYYEESGILPPARRRNGRRRYDASIVQRVAFIKAAQQAGFTLGEIRAIFYDFPRGTPLEIRWDAMRQPKLAELEARLTQLEAMKRRLHDGLICTCPIVEQCPIAASGTTS
jgi:MerR family redox-sensitive transcriptional activator SoxR